MLFEKLALLFVLVCILYPCLPALRKGVTLWFAYPSSHSFRRWHSFSSFFLPICSLSSERRHSFVCFQHTHSFRSLRSWHSFYLLSIYPCVPDPPVFPSFYPCVPDSPTARDIFDASRFRCCTTPGLPRARVSPGSTIGKGTHG